MKRWEQIYQWLPKGRIVTGVEVGVFRGKTSAHLLFKHPQLVLWLVDPWKAPGENDPIVESGSKYVFSDQKKFDKWYKETKKRIKDFKDRVFVMRMRSEEAVIEFKDNALDFVFIDGDHRYEAVRQDIKIWTEKVKPDGLILGHDYGSERFPGVAKAFDEMFSKLTVGCDHCVLAYKKDFKG